VWIHEEVHICIPLNISIAKTKIYVRKERKQQTRGKMSRNEEGGRERKKKEKEKEEEEEEEEDRRRRRR